MKKLAILIPSLESRGKQLEQLLKELDKQCKAAGVHEDVVIMPYQDKGGHSIGYKRNRLLEEAVKVAKYVCFFDDDDWPGPEYISSIMVGIDGDFDCCSLRGVMTTDGENPELFEHSIRYSEYKTTSNVIKYERYPNHLNVIRASIAGQFKFKEINHGEDTDWATQIHLSSKIKSEYFIPEVIYCYQYQTSK